MTLRYYISMGSNLGNKKAYLEEALIKLRNMPNITFVRRATWIETEPWGNTEQDTFINGLCVVDSALEPLALLDVLQRIEQEAGRERKVKWGPRTLDLDIIWAETVTEKASLVELNGSGTEHLANVRSPIYCKNARLELPHPYFWDRVFVLEPLAEVYPSFIYKNECIKARIKDLNLMSK